VAMRSVSVPLVVGWVDHFDARYSEASRNVFPHVPPEGPAKRWHYETIYVCDKCVQARSAWLQRPQVNGPNKARAANPVMTPRFHTKSQRRVVADVRRSVMRYE
jgi:hypothetical protein